jgi:hypothetical protein
VEKDPDRHVQEAVASEGVERQQDGVLASWKRNLEAARYAAQRAQKQYDAADLENRLVDNELDLRVASRPAVTGVSA